MNKAYVQQYVELERTHWWFVVRQKIILRILKKYAKEQTLSILNIGAAGGASTQWLSTLGKVVSVESDPFFFDHLKLQQVDVIHSTVTSMPFEKNSFDLVCAFDVIEHVADDFAAMKEMERVCKPGGMICVTVPAFQLLWSGHDVVNGHYRRYTKKTLFVLGELFAQLQNSEMRYFNSLLFLPVLIARKVSNIFTAGKKRVQSDFTFYRIPRMLDQILKTVFSAEIPLLRFIHFPVGVSLLAVWKKTGTGKLP